MNLSSFPPETPLKRKEKKRYKFLMMKKRGKDRTADRRCQVFLSFFFLFFWQGRGDWLWGRGCGLLSIKQKEAETPAELGRSGVGGTEYQWSGEGWAWGQDTSAPVHTFPHLHEQVPSQGGKWVGPSSWSQTHKQEVGLADRNRPLTPLTSWRWSVYKTESPRKEPGETEPSGGKGL